MKYLFFLICLSVFSFSFFAQTPFKPSKKRKDYFGSERNDVRQLSNIGLQISVGPTFVLASSNKLKSSTSFIDDFGNEVTSEINQNGKIGGNFEIGLTHFNMKSPKFSFGRIVDYFDYGIGFKYFRGTESTISTFHDSQGREIGQENGLGKLENGYVNFRFSLHKLSYIKKDASIFLDNALGVHADYLMLENSRVYPNMNVINQFFSKPLSVNLHYSFGLGMRLKRGSYLVPSAYVPILALEEFNKESIHWFSSRYYPITCQIKFIYLFNKSKKKTSCTTNGSEEDKKRNQEYLQNQ